MTRARKTHRWTVVEKLSKGDSVVEMQLDRETRRRNPDLPAVWRLRAIDYKRRGFRPQTLLTSLLDASAYPAADVISLYHERWEIELGFDEVKTEMLERQETIRSKTAAGVRQEFWGIALAYNLVRLEMQLAAELTGVPQRA